MLKFNNNINNNNNDDDDDDDDDDNNRIQRHKSRFFNDLLTAPRTASNTYAQVARAQSCANHVQHNERLSRTTDRVTCLVVRRDSSTVKFDRVEIAFYLSFILLAEPLTDEVGYVKGFIIPIQAVSSITVGDAK